MLIKHTYTNLLYKALMLCLSGVLISCGGSSSSISHPVVDTSASAISNTSCITDNLIPAAGATLNSTIESALIRVQGTASTPPVYSTWTFDSSISTKGAINFNDSSAMNVEIRGGDANRALVLEVLGQTDGVEVTSIPFFKEGNTYLRSTSSGIEQTGYEYVWSKRGFSHTTVSYSPAFRIPVNLTENVPFTQSYSVKRVTKGLDGTVYSTMEMAESRTLTFQGVESITVPAGTFLACKLRIERESMMSPSERYDVTEWTVAEGKNRGRFLKSVNHHGTIRQATFLSP